MSRNFLLFEKTVQESVNIVAATETLWLAAPPASEIRKSLKVGQLEALYEASFLRVFAAWENFLEGRTIRFMARSASTGYSPVAAAGKKLYRSQTEARVALFAGRTFLLWHNPSVVVKRVADHLLNCPVEVTVAANAQRLQWWADIRHSIAHSSVDSRAKMGAASIHLAGVDLGTAGHLLRSDDISDPLNRPRWIRVAVNELLGWAKSIDE